MPGVPRKKTDQKTTDNDHCWMKSYLSQLRVLAGRHSNLHACLLTPGFSRGGRMLALTAAGCKSMLGSRVLLESGPWANSAHEKGDAMTSRVRVRILALGFALFVALPAVSAAQGPVSIGVKAGLNIAKLKFEGSDAIEIQNPENLFGLVAGLYVSKPVSDAVSVRVEGLFSRKGFKSSFKDEHDGEQAKTRLTYIDVPVLLDFSPGTTTATRFHVFTGPQVSLYTKAELGADGKWVELDDDEVKGTDFAWVLGAGVSSGRFSADASYALGLSNIASSSSNAQQEGIKVKNRVLAVKVGVKLK
jgi:hypothetical protein